MVPDIRVGRQTGSKIAEVEAQRPDWSSPARDAMETPVDRDHITRSQGSSDAGSADVAEGTGLTPGRMRILVIEFTDSFLDSVTCVLEREGFRVDRLRPAQLPVELKRGQPPRGAVIGAAGTEESWLDALAEVRLDCSWVVVGAAAGTRAAVAALKSGAADYFTLPHELPHLASWAAEVGQSEADGMADPSLGMIGRSPSFLAAVRRLLRVIPDGRSSVLLLGETGTGKELFARALHTAGPRAGAPFVELNCAAIPNTLLESELFGYEAGAFTDARQSKPGLFEVANGGTFFLDEIGDLPLEMQAKLLRVLDYRRVRRVGGLSELDIDVRLVAATHRDLDAAVARGQFREDLLYRLNVIQLELPPLRSRREDILPLTRHFVAKFSAQYRLPLAAVGPRAAAALQRHTWPGNIRELRNAVERGLLLGQGRLTPEDMLPPARPVRHDRGQLPFPAPLEHIVARAAELMLEQHGGNKSSAAEALGVSRKRLYSLLRSRQVTAAGGD
jgi:DNA-binding NtrC family response regulator